MGGGSRIHTTPQAVLAGASPSFGAGMVNFQASPTVRNCVFENNQAGKGGAVYNMTATSFPPRPDASRKAPVFSNCVFRHNTANGRGGGISNDLGTSPVFLNCVFEENQTQQKGGGMYNDFGCSPTLVNCLFTGNSAESAGGMGNDGGSSPVLYHCTFTKNHAVEYGAPLYQGTGPASNPALVACVVEGNLCDWEDPGIYNWHDCSPIVKEGADPGYRAGRFTEAQLPQLLAELKPYQPSPAREPLAAGPEAIPSSERIVYADAAAAAPGDGRSWATAYASLPAAIADAGKDGAEVRMAAGTYKLGGDRSASFVLRPGVRLCGGYAGGVRDVAKHKTVLDGNHAYHVVTGASGAVLDGLTITGGQADGAGYDGKGGGLVNYKRGPQGRPNSEAMTGFAMQIRQCTFANNSARDGGAVYSYDRARPVFTDCVFAGNRADNGGAVLDRVGVESVFKNCEFSGNTARWRGGAVYFDYGSRPKLDGCVFRQNTAGAHGGGSFSVSRASQLENTVASFTACRFEANAAKGDGGAAAFCDSSIGVVQNCAFADNRAGRKGADLYTDATSSSGETAPAAGAERGGAGGFGGAPGGMGRNPGPGGAGRPEGQAGGGFRQGGEAQSTTFQPAADFSVVVLGSGSPQYDPKRSGPSVLVQYRGQYVLVDMGNGTQARLYELGVSLRDISALLLTHHHIDHNEEFIPMLVYRQLRGTAVEVVGPAGTAKAAAFAKEFYAEDMAYRMERRGRTLADAGAVSVREVKGGESFTLAGMKVTVAKVNHTIETVGYRFEAGGRSIVISGDLTYSDSLPELARDADVLVVDSGGSIVRQGASRRPGAAGQHNEAHSNLQEVCTMARKSGTKKLVLTHITGSDIDEAATAQALAEGGYQGKVIVGKDLQEVVPGKR